MTIFTEFRHRLLEEISILRISDEQFIVSGCLMNEDPAGVFLQGDFIDLCNVIAFDYNKMSEVWTFISTPSLIQSKIVYISPKITECPKSIHSLDALAKSLEPSVNDETKTKITELLRSIKKK
jgi:hypothetical protein